jgi:hypothetical protein
MPFAPDALPTRFAASAATLCMLCVAVAVRAEPPAPDPGRVPAVEARFRGCESAGWCRFWIEPSDPLEEPVHRVRPEGVPHGMHDTTSAIAVRDRLNALLASMIHQHKQVVLHDLRALDDGTFAATVTVNGADVATDPLLLELRGERAHPAR